MKTIIAGNWKMNLTIAESIALASGVAEQVMKRLAAVNLTLPTRRSSARPLLALYPLLKRSKSDWHVRATLPLRIERGFYR